jgi:hypothetical protein
MRTPLRSRIARPPLDRPGEVLRWLRRICVVAALLGLLLAAPLLASGDSIGWILVACSVLLALNALTMAPAIRKADRDGVITDSTELERRRRRGRRAGWIYSAALTLSFVAIGYGTDGIRGALIFLAFAVVITALGMWFSRSKD